MSDSTALTVRQMTPALYDEKRGPLELMARFEEDLKNTEAARQFLSVCVQYELDPFMGEIYPYQGRIYVGEPGWRAKIGKHAKNQLAGIDSRQATEAERTAYKITDEDWLAVATVTRRLPTGETFTTTARATVRAAELKGTRRLPIDLEPWAMAEKRARVRALRQAFGDTLKGHLPSEAGDDFGGVTVEVAAAPPENGGQTALTPPAEETTAPPTPKEEAKVRRSEFWAKAAELDVLVEGGKVSQAKTHKLLGLDKKCGARQHDAGEKNSCHALREWIQEMVRGGKTEGQAWETALNVLLNAQGKLSRPVAVTEAEWESLANEAEKEGFYE